MSILKFQTTVGADKRIVIENVPAASGAEVEVTVTVAAPAADGAEQRREAALARFLERASKSPFRSNGPYPSRDELHERD